MIKDLFEFPTAMVDGDNEDRKQQDIERLALESEEREYDIIYGSAMYPYYDFIGIEDRWLPTQESLDNALTGKFDACVVRFQNVHQPFLVPWSKTKFLSKLQKFTDEIEKDNSVKQSGTDMTVVRMTPEQLVNMFGLKDKTGKDDKQGQEGLDPEENG